MQFRRFYQKHRKEIERRNFSSKINSEEEQISLKDIEFMMNILKEMKESQLLGAKTIRYLHEFILYMVSAEPDSHTSHGIFINKD